VVAALLLAVPVSLAGCSSSPASPTDAPPSALSSSAAPGTLSGMARLYGGPVDPATGKQALNGEPSPRTKVTVRKGNATVATTTTDSLGRFSFTLAPGAYVLVCGSEVPFALATGQALNLDCPMQVP
jgi:hypothetical protein